MAYRQGDLVLIPVPFTDLSAQKQRPVIIVSGDNFNALQDDIIVVAVTSNPAVNPYTLALSNNELSEGKLPRISQIRTDKIYTLSQSIVVRRIGHVRGHILTKISASIGRLISSTG